MAPYVNLEPQYEVTAKTTVGGLEILDKVYVERDGERRGFKGMENKMPFISQALDEFIRVEFDDMAPTGKPVTLTISESILLKRYFQ